MKAKVESAEGKKMTDPIMGSRELMSDIAIGRKEIMAALHVRDWGTVRNWRRRYKLPVRYLPNNKPMIFFSEVQTWMITFSDLKKKQQRR